LRRQRPSVSSPFCVGGCTIHRARLSEANRTALHRSSGRGNERPRQGPHAPGRVDLGGRPPRSPTDPDVPVKGIRLVTLWRCPSHDPSACGHTRVRLGVLGMVPASGPQRGAPFAPRGPVGPVPPLRRYYGALRLLAVPLAALRFLRLAILRRHGRRSHTNPKRERGRRPRTLAHASG
jgi:hypothetical protein